MKYKYLALASLCANIIMPTASADTIGICVTKKTGAVRGVLNAAKCKKTETYVALNSPGIAGPQGNTGDKGDKGDPGIQGAKGETGATGAPGQAGSGGGKLKVYDANNQFLGYALGQRSIYIPSVDAKAVISAGGTFDDSVLYVGTSSPDEADLTNINSDNYTLGNYPADGLYSSSDCSGAVYGYAVSGIQYSTDANTYREFESNLLVRHYTTNADGDSIIEPGKYYLRKYQPALQIVLGSIHYPVTGGKGNVPLTPAHCQAVTPASPIWVRPINNDTEVTLPFTTPILLPLRYEVN